MNVVSLPAVGADDEEMETTGAWSTSPPTTGGGAGMRTNVAVTASAAFIVTTHELVPVHAPDQPANTQPEAAACVSVTAVPLAIDAEHVPGHEMPPVSDVTVPPPLVEALSVKLVGGATGTTSTAPMSHCAPCGRPVPRWSVPGQKPGSPASTAGLAAAGASVSVSPPLFCSGPSCAFVLCRSPGWVSTQLVSAEQVVAARRSAALQSPPVFPFTSVLYVVTCELP